MTGPLVTVPLGRLLELLAAADVIVAEYRVMFPVGPTGATIDLWIADTPNQYERLATAAGQMRAAIVEPTYDI